MPHLLTDVFPGKTALYFAELAGGLVITNGLCAPLTSTLNVNDASVAGQSTQSGYVERAAVDTSRGEKYTDRKPVDVFRPWAIGIGRR